MKTFLRCIDFLVNQNKKWFMALIFLAFLNAIFSLVEPIFFREIVDNLLSKNLSLVWKILFLWISFSLLQMFFKTFLTYFADVLVHENHIKISNWAIENLLQLSIRFHASRKSGSTMRKIDRGFDCIFETNLDFLREDVPRIFALIFLFPVLFYLNWKMATAMLIILPLITSLAIFIALKTNARQRLVEKKWSRATGFAFDLVANIAVIKSFVAQKNKLKKFNQLILSAHSDQLKVLPFWTAILILGKLATIVATILVFAMGTYLFSHGEITIGEIVMFLGFATTAVNHIESEFWHFQRFLWRKGKLDEFLELYDQIPEIEDIKKAKNFPSKIKGKVEFQNVYFSHDGKTKTLNNVSFLVKPGENVALVGHTGSGKSTTVNLLSRFFDINKGNILIDGFDIAIMKQNSLREKIGMVFQENLLFHTSILDNLSIGNPQANENKIKKACQAAYAWEFIKDFPQGLQTIVGERGVKLSGGEKQRIAIARALLKNPPILVLDEATSALDAETEKKIQQALEKLIKGRTTFIVAHRLSTIKKADKILVFEKGKIVESGKFSTLMHKKGKFAALVHAQVSGFVV